MANRKIDAVITWVNGDDPKHKAKLYKLGNKDFLHSEDVAGKTRFKVTGEIAWCVASLYKFAPWLNKIYIVTDDQNPELDDFLDKHFPDRVTPLEIVDHKEIFRGYEQYLPTFNSISIETMTWRIPGLSEYYLEINDDFMLAKPLTERDFLTEDGKLICYADKYSKAWTAFTRMIKPKINGRKKVTFKGTMLNSANIANQKFYILKIDHTPRILSRSFFEKFYGEHPGLMIGNIKHRFRNAGQFAPQTLQYLLQKKAGNCILKPTKPNLFYVEPKNKPNYIANKMKKLHNNPNYKFCCFNSIDKASKEDMELVLSEIGNRLGINPAHLKRPLI